jgi:uncharacterized membrane protein YfcA
MLGVFLGGRLNQAIPKARFERVLYFFLIGIGILLMV